jgi:hypothetical protein
MKTSILAGLIAFVLAASAVPATAATAQRPTKAVGIANCGGGTSVSNSGTSCTAVDRNCAVGERGHVSCTGGSTPNVNCPKSCACSEVCVCGVPCTEQCDSGGGFIQDCGSWGICATSCSCGGECLTTGDPKERSGPAQGQPSCAAPALADALLAKIFG